MKSLLVGTGLWSDVHLQAYALCKKAQLVGIVGHSNQQRMEAQAEKYGIDGKFMDLSRAIEEMQPDMVDISSAPAYRLEGVKACVGTSVKLVNIEKPMALLPSEAYEIERVCKENDLLLTVNHQKKFNAPWAKAKQIVAGGELGDIQFFHATSKGNMMEQGTHLIDMMLYFQGYTGIKWIMGQVGDLEGLDKPKTPAPDSAVATMEFSNGVRAMLTLGNVGREIPNETNKWFQFAIDAYGSKGHLNISLNQSLSVTSYEKGNTSLEPSSWDDTFLQGLADHFDAAAAYAEDPSAGHISCLDNSMMSIEAIMGIYASVGGGGKVEFPCRFEDSVVTSLKRP